MINERRSSVLALTIVFLGIACQTPARADWDPNGNLISLGMGQPGLSESNHGYHKLALVPDGEGGAFVVWTAGTYDDKRIYAQRVMASGEIAPGWPANGLPLTADPPNYSLAGQLYPQAVSDGAGGIIVAYATAPGSESAVYAQRITGAGTRAWPDTGVKVTAVPPGEFAIAADGAGGIFVAWSREYSDFKMMGTHLNASGTTVFGWPDGGKELCPQGIHQVTPSVVADGEGGAIFVWYETREGASWSVYGIRFASNGALVPGWPAEGTLMCLAPGDRYYGDAITDGAGGVFAAWPDYRAGSADQYAQHVTTWGTLEAGWSLSGEPVTTAAGTQFRQEMVADGEGGFLIVWTDARSGSWDIYASRMRGNGDLAPGWTPGGDVVSAPLLEQAHPSVVLSGAGGGLFMWHDKRGDGTTFDLYAGALDRHGDRPPSWPANGRALCTAPNQQWCAAMCSDGGGGAYVAWNDYRRGPPNADIYVTRISGAGAVPVAPVETAGPLAFALNRIQPNPASRAVTVSFRLATGSPAAIEWWDVHGRRALSRPLGNLGPGAHTVALETERLPAGVYFVRLVQGDRVATSRVAIAR